MRVAVALFVAVVVSSFAIVACTAGEFDSPTLSSSPPRAPNDPLPSIGPSSSGCGCGRAPVCGERCNAPCGCCPCSKSEGVVLLPQGTTDAFLPFQCTNSGCYEPAELDASTDAPSDASSDASTDASSDAPTDASAE